MVAAHRDWNAEKQQWGWARDPPVSQKAGKKEPSGKARKQSSKEEKALNEFRCRLCLRVASQPVATPCDHIFCKSCLLQRVRPRRWADVCTYVYRATTAASFPSLSVHPKAVSQSSLCVLMNIAECEKVAIPLCTTQVFNLPVDTRSPSVGTRHCWESNQSATHVALMTAVRGQQGRGRGGGP